MLAVLRGTTTIRSGSAQHDTMGRYESLNWFATEQTIAR